MNFPTRLLRRTAALLGAVALAAPAFALDTRTLADRMLAWKEDAAPPPPAYDAGRMIEFENGAGTELRWGVDPQTIAIGSDDVVRYVVIARSASGASNAFYEGLRCAQGMFKTYARAAADGQWRPVADPQWQDLSTSRPSSHESVLARNYICDNSARPTNVDEILRRFRNPFPR